MKLLGFGSREGITQQQFDFVVWSVFDGCCFPDMLLHGGCRGVDLMFARWAQNNGIPSSGYKADWARLGKKAGVLRTLDIIKCLSPDVDMAVGIIVGGHSVGSRHTVRFLQAKGVYTIVYTVPSSGGRIQCKSLVPLQSMLQ